MRLLTYRLGAPLAALLIASLALSSAGFAPSRASAASAPAAVSAVVTPSTVAPGGRVTVSGSGFGVREPVYVYLDTQSNQIGALLSTTNGQIPQAKVTIPATFKTGPHTLILVGQTTKKSASVAIMVSRASLTVTPAAATPGGQVTVSGQGFGAHEPVAIVLVGMSQPLAIVTSDSQGNLPPAVVTIPVTLAPGAHALVITGQTTHISASAALTINATVTATVAQASVAPGGKITVSGAGFGVHEPVVVTIAGLGQPLATLTSDANGAVTATAVMLPSTLASGAHTLLLTGSVTHRAASAPFTLATIAAPTMSLSAASGHPGQTLVITGQGFNNADHITLSLNGVVLTTSPSTILVNHGAFRAVIKLPKSLLSGANTISASGSVSHISTVASLTGTLPTMSDFYFAGASTMPGEQSSLSILNPSSQMAHISFTFYYASGAPGYASLDVPAHSRATADLNALAGPNRSFGIKLAADRSIVPELRLSRAGKDGAAMLGATAPQTTWYLAEGFTGHSFHEMLSLVNPSSMPAQVSLRLLPFSGRQDRTISIYVAAQSTRLVDVNQLYPNQSLSVIATSSTPIVAERTLTFSDNGYGMTAKTGINTPALSWIFAEGKTSNLFRTYLTILNPNMHPAVVTANFFGQDGAMIGSRTVYVPALRRANINLNHYLSASGISTVVSSDRPVVVERPEYTGDPNAPFVAGSDVFGRNGAGLSWAFPGGNTGTHGDHLLLFNPSNTTAAIDATFYGANGNSYTQRFYVAPMGQYDVSVNALAPSLSDTHGVVLHSANGVGIVAEQALSGLPGFGGLAGTQGFAS